MATTITRASDANVQRAMTADPAATAGVLAAVQSAIDDRRWGEEYTAALSQAAPFRGLTPGELLNIGDLNAGVRIGDIARVRVDVGVEPWADGAREENAQALVDLPEPFCAHLDLDQHAGDYDGKLWWDEPIRATAGDRPVELPARPNGIPLEVGTCNPSRMVIHLGQYGGVARWAYGVSELWVFVRLSTSPLAAGRFTGR